MIRRLKRLGIAAAAVLASFSYIKASADDIPLGSIYTFPAFWIDNTDSADTYSEIQKAYIEDRGSASSANGTPSDDVKVPSDGWQAGDWLDDINAGLNGNVPGLDNLFPSLPSTYTSKKDSAKGTVMSLEDFEKLFGLQNSDIDKKYQDAKKNAKEKTDTDNAENAKKVRELWDKARNHTNPWTGVPDASKDLLEWLNGLSHQHDDGSAASSDDSTLRMALQTAISKDLQEQFRDYLKAEIDTFLDREKYHYIAHVKLDEDEYASDSLIYGDSIYYRDSDGQVHQFGIEDYIASKSDSDIWVGSDGTLYTAAEINESCNGDLTKANEYGVYSVQDLLSRYGSVSSMPSAYAEAVKKSGIYLSDSDLTLQQAIEEYGSSNNMPKQVRSEYCKNSYLENKCTIEDRSNTNLTAVIKNYKAQGYLDYENLPEAGKTLFSKKEWDAGIKNLSQEQSAKSTHVSNSTYGDYRDIYLYCDKCHSIYGFGQMCNCITNPKYIDASINESGHDYDSWGVPYQFYYFDEKGYALGIDGLLHTYNGISTPERLPDFTIESIVPGSDNNIYVSTEGYFYTEQTVHNTKYPGHADITKTPCEYSDWASDDYFPYADRFINVCTPLELSDEDITGEKLLEHYINSCVAPEKQDMFRKTLNDLIDDPSNKNAINFYLMLNGEDPLTTEEIEGAKEGYTNTDSETRDTLLSILGGKGDINKNIKAYLDSLPENKRSEQEDLLNGLLTYIALSQQTDSSTYTPSDFGMISFDEIPDQQKVLEKYGKEYQKKYDDGLKEQEKELKEKEKQQKEAEVAYHAEMLDLYEKYKAELEMTDSGKDLPNDPAVWTEDDYNALADAISQAKGKFNDSIPSVDSWPASLQRIKDSADYNSLAIYKIIAEWPADKQFWTDGMQKYFDDLYAKYQNDPEFAKTLDDMIAKGVFNYTDPDDISAAIDAYIKGCTAGNGTDTITVYGTVTTSDTQTITKSKTWQVCGNPTIKLKSLTNPNYPEQTILNFSWYADQIGTYSATGTYDIVNVSYQIVGYTAHCTLQAEMPDGTRYDIITKDQTVILEDYSGIKQELASTKSIGTIILNVVASDIDLNKSDFFNTKRLY